VYTNPPRSGHGRKALDWFLSAKPLAMAYLSCHPRSLAGDLAVLETGFAVEALLPMDYFPQTTQVETLALLARK
jgi:23S rRNA (uracil1939-C5)-methyltransferase